MTLPGWAATLLRDADIEASLAELSRPVLQAAGLSPSSIRVLLVQDRSLNAFVLDHQHIFIHSGLLLKMKNASMLQAVIAHEAAHIANGHLARRAGNTRAARNAAGLGLILAAVTAAAGGGDAASGIALGTANSALRNLFSHTRAEEASADQASVRYLVRSGISPKGAVEVHELFRGQEALSSGRQDPYARSHPMSADRVRALKGYVAAYDKSLPPDPVSEYWFQRAKGKLSAFIRAPKWTLRRTAKLPNNELRLMQEAVAWHQQANLAKALPLIDKAIALRPGDAHLYDLKGEILLKSRKANAAVAAYARAVTLAPGNALIRGGYGRALLAAGHTGKALKELERARDRDFRDPLALRDLSVAYAKTGKPGHASLVTAERYALLGQMENAEIHAKRASGLLPRGSGPWQRAEDVLYTAQRARK